jgi:hypothetical protein
MAKIGVRQLRTYLTSRDHDELVDDIVELFKRLDAVKDYYQLRLADSYDEALLERYKARIKDEFFPARGFGEARLSIARKPITEYSRVSDSVEGLADLMLFYVEMGVAYTSAYGDINAPFYNSMESMYERALKLVVKEDMLGKFAVRCEKIVKDTSGMGWGFHDTLSEIYHEYVEPE